MLSRPDGGQWIAANRHTRQAREHLIGRHGHLLGNHGSTWPRMLKTIDHDAIPFLETIAYHAQPFYFWAELNRAITH
ncbi:hypothetical protein D3C79_916430 [compost metagenome]